MAACLSQVHHWEITTTKNHDRSGHRLFYRFIAVARGFNEHNTFLIELEDFGATLAAAERNVRCQIWHKQELEKLEPNLETMKTFYFAEDIFP